MSPPLPKHYQRTKQMDYKAQVQLLQLGNDATFDLITFIEERCKDHSLTPDEYVVSGTLYNDAEPILEEHGEGFTFSIGDVAQLCGE